MNPNLLAFIRANVAGGRPLSPSQALAADDTLNSHRTQTRSLQQQLASHREVLQAAVQQHDRDQAVKTSLIKEAQRQAQRASVLASALDDVLDCFTLPDGTWGYPTLRPYQVTRKRLASWQALVPATQTRRNWTQLVPRSQHDHEIQEARDSANSARKRSDHLLDIERQHADELRLRAQAEQKLREVTAERDALRKELSAATAEQERLTRASAHANNRSTNHWNARNNYQDRWTGAVAEARRQAARADAAEHALANLQEARRTANAQRAPRPGSRVQVTYEAEHVAQVDIWGRRRVRWTDSDQQVPAYVAVGSLPAHATVTVLDGGR